MKLIEPHYQLLSVGERAWRFEASEEMKDATLRFNDILESGGGRKGLTAALRAFLNEHPAHIDALYHYAMCKQEEGKPLDAYAFAHAAVAIGKSVFPSDFLIGQDRLPGGFVENRPFLRSLYGLMTGQREVFETRAAIETAKELIAFDPEDRLGARLHLPLFLLEENRDKDALEIFSIPGFEGTFHTSEYLRALALIRCKRIPEAEAVLQTCLHYLPQVARYLLQSSLPIPENNNRFGIASGSEYEGWVTAFEQGHVWRRTKGALEILDLAFKKNMQRK